MKSPPPGRPRELNGHTGSGIYTCTESVCIIVLPRASGCADRNSLDINTQVPLRYKQVSRYTIKQQQIDLYTRSSRGGKHTSLASGEGFETLEYTESACCLIVYRGTCLYPRGTCVFMSSELRSAQPDARARKINILIVFSARATVYSISIIKYVDISCTNHFSFSPCNTPGRGHLLDSFWHCQWFAGGQVGACRGHHANFSNWTRSIYCQLLSCRRVQDTRS